MKFREHKYPIYPGSSNAGIKSITVISLPEPVKGTPLTAETIQKQFKEFFNLVPKEHRITLDDFKQAEEVRKNPPLFYDHKITFTIKPPRK